MTSQEQLLANLTKKLSPESTLITTTRAGCLLLGYELIKYKVVEELKQFMRITLPNVGVPLDYKPNPNDQQRYKREVSSRNKSLFVASCEWLQEAGALTGAHVQSFQRIKVHRDEVTHELLRFLFDPSCDVDLEILVAAYDALQALDRFWIGIAIGGNEEYDNVDVKEEDLVSGSISAYGHIMRYASFDVDKLGLALRHFIESSESKNPAS